MKEERPRVSFHSLECVVGEEKGGSGGGVCVGGNLSGDGVKHTSRMRAQRRIPQAMTKKPPPKTISRRLFFFHDNWAVQSSCRRILDLDRG